MPPSFRGEDFFNKIDFLEDHIISISFTLSNWFSHFIGKHENIKQLKIVDEDRSKVLTQDQVIYIILTL